MCDIVCYIEIFWGLSHKNGSFSKKMRFFSFSFHHPIFSPSIGWSILIIVFRGWTFYGFWVKIIIVTGLAEIININRLNSPSTAAWSLKVLEKRPKTALNFVFFCVIFGNFSVFGCVTDCVMCDASGRILCARMAVITWHAITGFLTENTDFLTKNSFFWQFWARTTLNTRFMSITRFQICEWFQIRECLWVR